MNGQLKQLFLISMLLGLFISAFTKTLTIPDDYSTIQAGLNAADSSDTVYVKAGTYQENIFWPDKNGIKLIGEDSSNTVIDGGGDGSVVHIDSNVDSEGVSIDTSTLIKKFTIRNGGNIAKGGGIFLIGNAKIETILIKNNIASSHGGGIYCSQTSPLLKNVTISRNYAKYGGGICCLNNSSPILVNVNIKENFVNENGGGIYITSADLNSTSTIVFDNIADWRGGGIYCHHWAPTLENIIISNNSAREGGGICCHASSPFLTNLTITYNYGEYGGGICCLYNSSLSIKEVTFIKNKSSFDGAGIYTKFNSSPSVNDCNFINQNYSIYNNDNSITINAINNYFGNISGPYHPTQNPSGKGDTVNSFVNIASWLTTPSITAPPIPIRNLEVTDKGNDFITLNWSSSRMSDLESYRIYYDTDTTDFYEYTDSIDVNKSDTSVTISGLSAGKTYYFSGITLDTAGNKSWYSKEISVIVKKAPILSLKPDSLLFPSTVVNNTSSNSLTIDNTGTKELDVNDMTITSDNFSVDNKTLSIPPSDSDDVIIHFTPKRYGEIEDTLTIYNNSMNDSTATVLLKGFGDLPSSPRIVSINDIPDDQGGKVRIKFKRSKFDGLDSSSKIESYTIWRKINSDEWDGINSFNAVQDSIYNTVVPTLGDSTVDGITWSLYRITAHTQDPDIFYYSDVDSGYSVDNIAPGVPDMLDIESRQEHIMLTWKSNKEEDFQYYAVYRSKHSGFNPDTMSSFTYATSDTVLKDDDMETNTTYYYKVSAIDHAGNESEYSETVSTMFTGIGNNTEKPTEYSLGQNYPNPFNPTTTIKYGLKEDCRVTISVYDLQGNLVETILEKDQTAGYHKVNWHAQDVPTGVYFYKIRAGKFTDVKKCVLMK